MEINYVSRFRSRCLKIAFACAFLAGAAAGFLLREVLFR